MPAYKHPPIYGRPTVLGIFHLEDHGGGMFALMLTGPRQRKPRFVRWVRLVGEVGKTRPTVDEFNAACDAVVADRTAPKDAPRYGDGSDPNEGPISIYLVGKLKP